MEQQVNMNEIMVVEMVEAAEIQLVGFQNQTEKPYQDEKRLFEQLELHREKVPYRKDDNVYLLLYIDEESRKQRMIVGIAVHAVLTIPEGMVHYQIPGRQYKIFKFPQKHIGDFWAYIGGPIRAQEYGISQKLPRYEVFNEALTSTGMVNIYYPSALTARNVIEK